MPGNRQAFEEAISVADRYRWNSQWTEAAREYQRALAEFPDDMAARGGLGFCCMQTKQWQQALEQYEYMLQQEPGNVIALSKTAELYGILKRRDDAYKAYLHLADLYSQAGQGARAEAAWQKAVQLSPSNPEPHERLASYYFEKKEIALMVQERLAAAQGHLVRNELGLARVQCEEALRADANNQDAQQLLTHILKGRDGNAYAASNAPFSETAFSPAPGERETMGYMGQYTSATGDSSAPSAFTGGPLAYEPRAGNISGGNTGIMGNMGSAGNFGGAGNQGPSLAMNGQGANSGPAPRRKITANQVTGVLKQAQAFQAQGRFNDAIDLCEQILESGFDRPDAQYFLGWLYQEQQRWEEAIRRFQMLLNDPDYALSCYYALGQCYRAKGDLRTATVHFDEAVDRVNLDALTLEESDQLVQLCQEAAEAHRMLGEHEQALTVYNALLGFLRSRGWNDKVAQVEFMLQQAQNMPTPPMRSATPPGAPVNQAPISQMTMPPTAQPAISDAATMTFNAAMLNGQSPVQPAQSTPSGQGAGELPEWLTGILSDADKTQIAGKPANQPKSAPLPTPPSPLVDQPTVAAPIANLAEASTASPAPLPVAETPKAPAAPSWLMDEVKPAAPLVPPAAAQPAPVQQPVPPAAAQPAPVQQPVPPVAAQPTEVIEPVSPAQQTQVAPTSPSATPVAPVVPTAPAAQIVSVHAPVNAPSTKAASAEELLAQIAGKSAQDEGLKQVAEAVLASTSNLPETVRLQVVRAMQDIQNYINHGLLTSATEECLRVIDMAPQYLDVHQVLCEIYVRQGKIEQAITKYAILVDTYIVNGRTDDAIATYRRILQLEPNNLTYRMRLINLLSSHGDKEDLLRERTQAAESYLRLGYMDRALTELEQALQESPTSVPTRLNYALALHKLGRIPQAVAEYQRVLQVDPRNLTALVRWHIAMVTRLDTPRANSLEALTRIRWQLRGEGQKHYDVVAREYTQGLETYPNNIDLHFALGQLHQQAAMYDKALSEYELSMRDGGLEVMARMSAAQSLLAQGRPEGAIAQLEQALQNVRRAHVTIDPAAWAARPREEGEQHQAPEIEISLLLAKSYERTGRLDQKQAILRQIKQSHPAQDEVSSAMAEISAARQGDLEGALQEYTELVRHYRSHRQSDNALSVLNEMVRLAPQDARAHDELAEIYVSRGLLDEGIAELRLLSEIYLRQNKADEASAAFQHIGSIYADMGNEEEAFIMLKRAVELNAKSMDLLREVVGYCLRLNRYQEAAKYQALIAHHYFETQQIKESVAALQQLITIDHSNYEAYDMLGQTYQSVGEYEQASRVYRNLAKVNPDSSLARERLAALQELRAR